MQKERHKAANLVMQLFLSAKEAFLLIISSLVNDGRTQLNDDCDNRDNVILIYLTIPSRVRYLNLYRDERLLRLISSASISMLFLDKARIA